MNLGDKVYFVPHNPMIAPKLVEVTYNGQHNFMAGEFTFKRAKGHPYIGTHWRVGRAWASKEAYDEWRGVMELWEKLRLAVAASANGPPPTLTAYHIEVFLKQMKG